MMTIELVVIPGTAVPQPLGGETTAAEMSRVRSSHQELRTLITSASEQSPTFRRMVQTINSSDGIVYIEPGACRHGVRACLVTVSSAGRHRSLFVKVDIIRAERKLMAAIGHELHHAIELLSDPAVRDYAAMVIFYMKKGERVGTSTAFETAAAMEAGETVADEIRRFQRARPKD